ncbi:DUF423 domain-containing protein [Gluconobacter thailandicus]|uniref:DUF423 domain-containing protein n=1 Tax=Gluconobacter thailandicus TaxID=257438 RepID=A0AAP9ENZ9_GLUTH|nr:DUF423 domain-containing protein [Gluconobacter thailandicus]QEH94883.1 DUF423 domain-containing protein [Gluconobacter thailandicus]
MSANPRRPALSDIFRFCFVSGALGGALGLVLGTLASHLPDTAFAVPNGRAVLHTGVEILMWHAIALCALALGAPLLAPRLARLACLTMVTGTVLFCTPVTLFALFDLKIGALSVARIAPYGGTLLIISWLLAAASGLRKASSETL